MYLNSQSETVQNEYFNFIKLICSLSNLYSVSTAPLIDYRACENIFCKVFKADNLSRSDISIDARKEIDDDIYGFGIKTFLEANGMSYQKIAEFNKERELYHTLVGDNVSLVKKISELRNKRLNSTFEMCNTNINLYHCLTRSPGIVKILEEDMHIVDIDHIKLERNSKKNKNSIFFNDHLNEYKFDVSKSTLYKRFYNTDRDILIEIEILEDPYNLLKELIESEGLTEDTQQLASVILPLYSTRTKLTKIVAEKSGLNQGFARGRIRHNDEVYIPIPKWIQSKYSDFFPARSRSFNLKLPNSTILTASICQDNGKALMSNPNKALGKWILRKVLNIPNNELVTYEMLEEAGIDSVEVTKIDANNYTIDFKELGSYEVFKDNYSDKS